MRLEWKGSNVSQWRRRLRSGSQLVGNPSYGIGKPTRAARRFGLGGMYSDVLNVFNRPGLIVGRVTGYSYYNDVGRYRHTSPKQADAQNKTFEQTKNVSIPKVLLTALMPNRVPVARRYPVKAPARPGQQHHERKQEFEQ